MAQRTRRPRLEITRKSEVFGQVDPEGDEVSPIVVGHEQDGSWCISVQDAKRLRDWLTKAIDWMEESYEVGR